MARWQNWGKALTELEQGADGIEIRRWQNWSKVMAGLRQGADGIEIRQWQIGVSGRYFLKENDSNFFKGIAKSINIG